MLAGISLHWARNYRPLTMDGSGFRATVVGGDNTVRLMDVSNPPENPGRLRFLASHAFPVSMLADWVPGISYFQRLHRRRVG